MTVNYNINATTFLEGTYGRAGNQLAGCGGLPVNDSLRLAHHRASRICR